MTNLAGVLRGLGRFGEALMRNEEVTEKNEVLLGVDDPRTLTSMSNTVNVP